MPLLNRHQVIPYELELRDTTDAALYHYAGLAAAATEVLRFQDVNRALPRLDQDAFSAQGRAQSRLFDSLEAFLTAFARVSLLLFPTGGSQFTRTRADTLQSCLRLDDSSPLANRDLRDSWMHHDERIDYAVQNGLGSSGQVFTRSTEDPGNRLKAFLRVIEVDTLIVHFRDRRGQACRADLRSIATALKAVDARRVHAFNDLPQPPGAA